jgi:hypothetical protein
MRWTYLLVALVLICAATVFLPHFRRPPESYKPTTLGGIYMDFFSDRPANLKAETIVLFLLLVIAALSSFFPALLALLIRAFPPGTVKGIGILYVLAGLVVAVGAVVNFAIVILNRTPFQFGTPPPIGIAGVFAWGVGLWQMIFALASIVMGGNSSFAGLIRRCVQ